MEKKTKRALIGVLCGIPIVAGGVAAIFLSKNCSPDVQQCTVNFAVKDADKEVAYVSKKHISVKKGITFGEIKSQSSAYKTIDNKDWPFQYWEDASGTKVEETLVIDNDLTVFANFKEPTPSTILISFTVDPDDSEGVVIDKPFMEIPEGSATFAQVANKVTATRTTDEGTWTLDHWYKDGYPNTSVMDPNIILTKTLEVHPYFIAPEPIVHKIKFDVGDSGAKITSRTGETSYTVKHGTTLGELLAESELKADKEDYAFQWWTPDLHPEREEGQEWIPPVCFKDEYEITDDITLYPYFVEDTPAYISKTIVWEQTTESTPQPFPTLFQLPDTQYIFGTSHFLLTKSDGVTPITLQEGETIELEEVSVEGYQGLIAGTMADYSDPMSNRIKVTFRINQEMLAQYPSLRGQNVPFKVKFKIAFNGETKIEPEFNLAFNIEQELQPAQIEYHNAPATTELTTDEGMKDFTFNSSERVGTSSYFTLSRPLKDDESIEPVITVSDTGEDVSNIAINNIHVVEKDSVQYLDFSVAFKNITGLAYEHVANFDLAFAIVRGETEARAVSLSHKFSLIFTPIVGTPYAVGMYKTYIFEKGTTDLSIEIQVEYNPDYPGNELNSSVNEEMPRFRKGHFMTLQNETPSSILHIASPSDGHLPPEGSIEGDDTNTAYIDVYLDYDRHDPPKEWTSYPAHLNFSFWNDNAKSDLINDCPRDITFYYDPVTSANKNYTNDTWAKLHSIGIIQKATNKSSNEEEVSLGTAWVISWTNDYSSDFDFILATSYDIKNDYNTLRSNAYENYKLGLFTPESAVQTVKNDSTEYISLDNENSQIYYINPDHNLSMRWKPALTWNGNIGPDMALFEIRMSSDIRADMSGENEKALRMYIQPKAQWWRNWGDQIDQLPQPLTSCIYNRTSNGEGGLTPVGESMLPFDKSYFSYGYVGGFKSANITSTTGKKKTAVYWKSFQMNLGWGDLDLVGPGTYYFFCNRDGRQLGPDTTVINRCPAFALIDNAFKKKEYLDAAGRGAMFMLRPRGWESGTLGIPMIAGINTWDGTRYGKSNLNVGSHVTPYFDCFVFDDNTFGAGSSNYNLLAPYMTQW